MYLFASFPKFLKVGSTPCYTLPHFQSFFGCPQFGSPFPHLSVPTAPTLPQPHLLGSPGTSVTWGTLSHLLFFDLSAERQAQLVGYFLLPWSTLFPWSSDSKHSWFLSGHLAFFACSPSLSDLSLEGCKTQSWTHCLLSLHFLSKQSHLFSGLPINQGSGPSLTCPQAFIEYLKYSRFCEFGLQSPRTFLAR